MADQLSRVFAALADPTRRDMVARLTVADATVNELADPYSVSLQAVSKHLKVLEDAGLVTRTRQAQTRPVHLEAEVFDLMTAWIERYRRQAEARYRRLDAVLADLGDQPPPDPVTDRPDLITERTTAVNTSTIEATIEADEKLPVIRITRDFAATPAQLMRAHLDPRPVRPLGRSGRDGHHDRRLGRARRGQLALRRHPRRRGVRVPRLLPPDRAKTRSSRPSPGRGCRRRCRWRPCAFEDLGDGRSRLHAQSLVDSFESRDAWLRSGMETGVNEGYAKLDRLLSDGTIA